MADLDPPFDPPEDSLDRNGKARVALGAHLFNRGQFRLLSDEELDAIEAKAEEKPSDEVEIDSDSPDEKETIDDLNSAAKSDSYDYSSVVTQSDEESTVAFVTTPVQHLNLRAGRKIQVQPTVKQSESVAAQLPPVKKLKSPAAPKIVIPEIPVPDTRPERNGPDVIWVIWDSPAARIAAFLLLLFVFSALFVLCSHPASDYLLAHRRQASDLGYFGEMVSALLTYWIMVRYTEHRKIGQTGFAKEKAYTQFLQGVVIGGVCASILFAVLIGMLVCTPGKTNENASLWVPIIMCLVIAVAEEVIFRGYILRVIENRFGSLAGILLSCGLFGLIHYVGVSGQAIPSDEKILGPLCIALGEGFAFGAAFIATRKLWLPIGMHFATTLVVGPIMGFNAAGAADAGNSLFNSICRGEFWQTGGYFGPEASVPAVLIYIVLGAILLVRAVKNGKWRKAGQWEPASLE